MVESVISSSEIAVVAHPANSRVKRALDLLVACLALTTLAPALVVIVALVVTTSGWPSLYRQRRIGMNGRSFELWKFRTMVHGADASRASLDHLNEAPFPLFKLRSDPRVTPMGRFLRRSGLDELPQLWNVVRGEMSLVGPRPALPREVSHYDAKARQRLTVRPGITGLWQIQQRNNGTATFEECVRIDIRYIETWSISSDLRILVRTLRTVLQLTGQ